MLITTLIHYTDFYLLLESLFYMSKINYIILNQLNFSGKIQIADKINSQLTFVVLYTRRSVDDKYHHLLSRNYYF